MKKNLLTSLKKLLKAFGGENSNKTNIIEVVDEITETLSSETILKSKNLVEAIDKLSNQVSKSSSGDNLNSRQIIVGTVGNPFGDVDYNTLKAALANGNASALLMFNYLDTPVPLPLQGETFIYGNAASLTISPNEYTATNVWWEDATTMNALMVSNLSSDVVIDAAQIVQDSESILTIIWHPLPEASS